MLKNKPYFLLGAVCVSLVLTLTFFVLPQRLLRASTPKATLQLPNSLTVTQNEVFSLPIMLNTEGESIAGLDIVIAFTKQVLELKGLTPHPTNSTLKCFFPLTQDRSFNQSQVVNEANSTGRIVFGAIAQSQTGDVLLEAFQGVLGPANPLATLSFKALSPGSTTISFITNPANQPYSIVTRESDSQNTLAGTTPLTLIIRNTGCTACNNEVPAKNAGNANCDGTVDLRDLNYWLNQFVTNSIDPARSADFNCDGQVNRQDLTIWQATTGN